MLQGCLGACCHEHSPVPLAPAVPAFKLICFQKHPLHSLLLFRFLELSFKDERCLCMIYANAKGCTCVYLVKKYLFLFPKAFHKSFEKQRGKQVSGEPTYFNTDCQFEYFW